MEAKEFTKKVQNLIKLLPVSNGSNSNCGVGFFISDIQELIEEWESEYHEYKM